MQRHVILICFIALMCIQEGKNLISYQPIPPFSVNFLKQVPYFSNTVEPELRVNDFEVRDTNSDDSTNEDCPNNNKNCPDGKCPRFVDENESKNSEILDYVEDIDSKKKFSGTGDFLVNKEFGSDEFAKRRERDFQAVQTPAVQEEGKENRDNREGITAIKNPDSLEEKSKTQNASNSSKPLSEDIDSLLPVTENLEEVSSKEIKEEKPDKSVAFIQNDMKQSELGGSSDLLEMHFYKHIPDTGSIEIHPPGEKPVLINLYPEQHQPQLPAEIPTKQDFVFLLIRDENNNLLEIPAIKLNEPPERTNTPIKRDNFAPFVISKYKRIPSHFRFEPNDQFFNFFDNKKKHHFRQWSHKPVVFVNTIPAMKRKSHKKFHRRSSDSLSNNHYLREADSLIQNIKTSLKIGFPNLKNFGLSDNVDSKSKRSFINRKTKNHKRRIFKKEINKGVDPSNANKQQFRNNFLVPLLKDHRSAIRPMESKLNRNNNFHGNWLKSKPSWNIQDDPSKNEDSSDMLLPKRYSSKSNDEKTLPQKELNSYLALLKKRISIMKEGPSKMDGLTDEDGFSLDVK